MRKLRSWIKEGRGTGHGASYTPFIRIHRKNMPSGSRLHQVALPFLHRQAHYLSTNEYRFALFLWWLGVSDLREQFPCWPWPHPHPLYGHPDYRPPQIVQSSGTTLLAKSLGLNPLVCEGSPIRYVPTIDLLATVHLDGEVYAHAFAIKPGDEIRNDRLTARDHELLAIQGAYARELDIPCHLAASEDLPFGLQTNLEVLLGYSVLMPSEIQAVRENCRKLFTRRLETRETLSDTLSGVASMAGISFEYAQILFHHFLWHRQINVDVREPWVMNQPPALTDYRWLPDVWQRMFGAANV
jgi:hypothetical protein